MKFFRVMYKMAKQRNLKHEIKATKKLLKNNHDTLSRHEIDEIRYNLYNKEFMIF